MSGHDDDSGVTVEKTADRILISVPHGGAAVMDPVDPDLSHSPDYTAVKRDGVSYTFSRTQALIVQELFKARRRGYDFVHQKALLRAADSDSDQVGKLFKNHPAWGKLIVSGRGGMYRISP